VKRCVGCFSGYNWRTALSRVVVLVASKMLAECVPDWCCTAWEPVDEWRGKCLEDALKAPAVLYECTIGAKTDIDSHSVDDSTAQAMVVSARFSFSY
jgi:hypothetical protein